MQLVRACVFAGSKKYLYSFFLNRFKKRKNKKKVRTALRKFRKKAKGKKLSDDKEVQGQ